MRAGSRTSRRASASVRASAPAAAACASAAAAFAGLSRAVATGSAKRTAEADFEFHRVIVELAEHQRLAQQYRLVEQQVRLSIASSNALLSDLRTVLEQHQPIADAVLSARPHQAAKLAEQHALSEGEKLVEHLEKIEQRKSGTRHERRK
jgi:DNA-binding FadR family transcriptional regulator